MTFGSDIVDVISRHIARCSTCTECKPDGLATSAGTQQALKSCFVYAELHRSWRRWINFSVQED